MNNLEVQKTILLGVKGLGAIALSCFAILPVNAQIIPDQTLGTEQSILTPTGLRDLIQGGAIRGDNLFHSFQEFNVQNNQQVYFTNPSGINNILTRVTGVNPSQVLGTLGVEGAANLFLINPRGIYFGPNAHLDIAGSFFATTADAVLFDNGFAFSASNPQAPPLLTFNITPGIQWGNNPGSITNEGHLSTGQNLTLLGHNLTLQGQLEAGNDLTLQALDTVQIRDTATSPFIAAGGHNLVIQGNQLVDIFALNHSQSHLMAGSEMVLRSANPVIGDAHYWSGGGFKVEGLNGEAGTLLSPTDPVIRALGDVTLNNYTGTSLHIIAGGKVTILGNVTITGSDATNGLSETIALSDGTSLLVDGKSTPTLDIRAGVSANAIGIPGTIGTLTPTITDSPSSADVKIGVITMSPTPGKVLITNQYQPNSALSGSVQLLGAINNFSTSMAGGDVAIDSRNNLIFSGDIYAFSSTNNGGNINLLATGDITLTGSAQVITNGSLGGNIKVKSSGNISLNGGQFTSQNFRTTSGGSVPTGGNIEITAGNTLSLNGGYIATQVLPNAIANAGNVIINAGALQATNSGVIETSTKGTGNAGDLIINSGSVSISSSYFKTLVDSNAVGNAGDMIINTGAFSLSNQAFLSTSTLGTGNAGNFTLNANSVNIDGGGNFTGITTSIESSGVGNSGGININTNSLNISSGGIIATAIIGQGSGPSVNINADTIEITGTRNNGFPSAIVGAIAPGGVGNAVAINVNTRTLSLLNGAQINAGSAGTGNAAPVNVKATESVLISGQRSVSLTTSFNGITPPGPSGIINGVANNATGNGGQITINTPTLLLDDTGVITSNSYGQGQAGDITINAYNVTLNNQAAITAETTKGDGGNITFNVRDILLLRNNSTISTSAGTSQAGGNGGNITISAGFIVAIPNENSDIIANAFSGNGGNITINTKGIYGLTFRSSATSESDITASSQFGLSGSVSINTPEIDPVQGLTSFPTEFADSSGLIVQNCPRSRSEAERLSQFIITGRGGVPAAPNEFIIGETVLTPWVSTGEEVSLSQEEMSQNHDENLPLRRGLGCQLVSYSEE